MNAMCFHTVHLTDEDIALLRTANQPVFCPLCRTMLWLDDAGAIQERAAHPVKETTP